MSDPQPPPAPPLTLVVYHPDGTPFCVQTYRLGQAEALTKTIAGKLWATVDTLADAARLQPVVPADHVNGSAAPLSPLPTFPNP